MKHYRAVPFCVVRVAVLNVIGSSFDPWTSRWKGYQLKSQEMHIISAVLAVNQWAMFCRDSLTSRRWSHGHDSIYGIAQWAYFTVGVLGYRRSESTCNVTILNLAVTNQAYSCHKTQAIRLFLVRLYSMDRYRCSTLVRFAVGLHGKWFTFNLADVSIRAAANHDVDFNQMTVKPSYNTMALTHKIHKSFYLTKIMTFVLKSQN